MIDVENGPKLKPFDYVLWFFTIMLFFAVFMVVGDFGNLGYIVSSPTGDYVQQLWGITYFLAAILFGVFMGSLVYLAVKFRAGAVPQAVGQIRPAQPTDYGKVALPILIIVGAVFVFVMAQALGTLGTNSVEFIPGWLGGLGIFLLGAVIFVIYKQYYKD